MCGFFSSYCDPRQVRDIVDLSFCLAVLTSPKSTSPPCHIASDISASKYNMPTFGTCSGNTGVWVSTRTQKGRNRIQRRKKRWRYIGSRRVWIVRKLDESQVKWMLGEKRKGTCNKKIAETMNVSVRWVQALWARYRDDQSMVYPYPMGRPENGLPGRREHSAIL